MTIHAFISHTGSERPDLSSVRSSLSMANVPHSPYAPSAGGPQSKSILPPVQAETPYPKNTLDERKQVPAIQITTPSGGTTKQVEGKNCSLFIASLIGFWF